MRGTTILVAYYSSTGAVHRLAEAVVAGAERTGATVRLRRIPELAPTAAIAANPAWAAHAADTSHIDEVTLDDLRWADGVVLGTPAHFGLPASQVGHFIEQTRRLWDHEELANKAYASFAATATGHGGAEAATLALNNAFSHWGGVIVPPGVPAAGLPPAEHLGLRVAAVAAATAALRPRERPPGPAPVTAAATAG